MGRRRTFDEDEAVTTAAALFRRQGYEATSVDDLVTATGVHRASLYGVFGSKYGLFRRALDQDLAALSDQAARGHGGPPQDRLDLTLVALLELAPSDAAVRRVVGGALDAAQIPAQDLGNRLIRRAGLPAL
ncbi:MAG: TetR/AcrR family transcriptional regulator [Propionibacteriales bacterium]|nr:TetR/AcrR family transcriptional regulator [Propionibacteriales bacterium]